MSSPSLDLLPFTVLIVAADPVVRAAITTPLSSVCFTQEASSVADAHTLCTAVPMHLLFVADQLPDGDGADFCAWAARTYPSSVRILFGKSPSMQQAFKAINSGHIWHYFTGDIFGNPDSVRSIIEEGIEQYSRYAAQLSLVDELRSSNDALERKVQQRTRDLIALNEELCSVLDRMQTLVMTDELTGLYNRRMLLTQLDSLFKQSQRYQTALSCVVCDLDGFKAWNEEYGHEAGDALLRRVGTRIHSLLRDVDITCRAGGDSFSLILPHTNSSQARCAIERIQRGLTEVPYLIGSKSYKFRANFGVAEVTSSVENAIALYHRAAKAELLARTETSPNPIATYPDPENARRQSVHPFRPGRHA